MNYLEQLAAEWYEYRGYFVRRNVLVGKRPNGGWECELDVVAFHPQQRHLVHVEPSMDADSWSIREARFRKKFDAGKRYIPKLFSGFDVPADIEQVFLLGLGACTNNPVVGGGRVVPVSQFMKEIVDLLRTRRVEKQAVPEQFPRLRTIQFVCQHEQSLFRRSP
jgi:hypothetical protein